jgi:hypothetical protein
MADDGWRSLVDALSDVDRAIARVTAVNINADSMRETARNVVQSYFRRARPDLVAIGLPESELSDVDGGMQRLLTLANGRNAKTSYTRVLRALRQELQRIELLREFHLGERERSRQTGEGGFVITEVESRIIATLTQLVPTAALSYEQALRDLAARDTRVSFRGTANELREALREIVDHLAPDEDVMAAQGFALERDRTRPTQRQKVRYILRSRRVPENARSTPEQAVTLVEELTAGFARAASERSSIAAHIATTRQEVQQMKMYVDGVLAELLQVHA